MDDVTLGVGRWVEVDVAIVVAETPKAVLVRFAEDAALWRRGQDCWVPYSQLRDPNLAWKGKCNFVAEVTRWFAEQQGIE